MTKKTSKNGNPGVFLLLAVSPIFIIALFGLFFVIHERNVVAEKYGLAAINQPTFSVLFDKTMLLDSYTNDEYDRMEKEIAKDSSCTQDLEFLQKWNNSLKKKYSFLVVKTGNDYTYFGEKKFYSMLEKKLPTSRGKFSTKDATYARGEKEQVIYKKISFVTAQGERGNFFIVTDVGVSLPHVQVLTYGFLIATMIVLIIFSAVIMGYVYIHVIKPIKQLRLAVKSIEQGEYEKKITFRQENEFSELYSDFENMRATLMEIREERESDDQYTRELIGNISHDLKTPLTAIRGYAEAIRDGLASSPERMNKYIQTIYEKATDMTSLVDELSYFSTINKKNVIYYFHKTNANIYFSSCVSQVSTDMEYKHICVIFKSDVADNVEVDIDVNRMKRVLNNILGNAGKYIDKENGTIFVQITDIGELIQVRIEDNGKGIEENELPFIFDRFYRTDSSRNSATGGTGLGLAITKKIVEDHGGTIYAESVAGKGTAIIFTIRKCRNDD